MADRLTSRQRNLVRELDQLADLLRLRYNEIPVFAEMLTGFEVQPPSRLCLVPRPSSE